MFLPVCDEADCLYLSVSFYFSAYECVCSGACARVHVRTYQAGFGESLRRCFRWQPDVGEAVETINEEVGKVVVLRERR